MSSNGPMIAIEHLSKSYGPIEAVKDVSISVERGDAMFVIGPSGCGKSTFLRCINLLEQPSAGRMRVGGTEVEFGAKRPSMTTREQAKFRANVGMVFQQFHLFPHMTALQNVMEGPLTVKGMRKAEAREIAAGLLAKVGLADKHSAYPRQLSGGQAQRVAIARALAMDPAVVLFDEVTSALDPELVGEVLEVMRQLTDEGMTMIVVTHEMGFAREVATQVVFMEHGSVLCRGAAAEVLDHSVNPRVQAFLRRFRH